VEPLLQWKSSKLLHILSVSVPLVMEHAMRMRHIFICGLFGTTVFFHIISKCTIFGAKSCWT